MNLLRTIEAPSGAQLLLTAVQSLEDCLVRLADETGDAELRRFRDLTRQVLRLATKYLHLIDQGFVDAKHIDAPGIYQIYAVTFEANHWERQTIRDAITVVTLLDKESSADVTPLIEGFFSKISLPAFPVKEEAILPRILLLARFLARFPRSRHDDLSLAVGLEKVAAILTSREGIRPAPENLKFIDEWQPNEKVGREIRASDRVAKLTRAVTARLIHSIRHEHAPAVTRIPRTHDVQEMISYLKRGYKDDSRWVLAHVLLGQYACHILGKESAGSRISITRVAGNPVIVLASPSMRAASKANEFPNCMPISTELRLPLPTRFLGYLDRIVNKEGYSYAKMAARVSQAMRRRGIEEGVSLGLNRMLRLLPAQMDACLFDSTLKHLLGFSSATARDAGIYYFSPSAQVVDQRFKKAVITLAAAIQCMDDLGDSWSDAGVQGHFGISIRPDIMAIRRLVEHLKNASRLPRGRPSISARRDAFNAHAAFVTLMFLAATGARPTEHVVPPRELLETDDGLAVLSEKDSLLYRSTRFALLPDRVNRALQDHADRRRELESALKSRLDNGLSVFVIDDSGAVLPPTIANLKATVPGFCDLWTWPNDVLRHHFRSRLWELGCPTDSIVFTMGHVGKSQTPDNILASQPIERTLAPVLKHVETLLDELGF